MMKLLPLGRDAVLVEVATPVQAVSLATWARERFLAREVVPGAESVLFDGLLGDAADPGALAGTLAGWHADETRPGPLMEVPVVYDGPDVEDVALAWGCSAEEMVRRHRATEFVSAFCGFAPGFAYLSGLSELEADVPRLAAPRTRVAAGSVALAGRWCGIYPRETPGGWRLIGRTDARLWDVTRNPPALLAPGTRVRFVPA